VELALSKVQPSIRHQVFLIAGWAYFKKSEGLRSFFCTITNYMDESYRPVVVPFENFRCRIHALPDKRELLLFTIGVPLKNERNIHLERNLRQLVKRQIGPKEALRLLVDEIINSSVREKCPTVGNKILGFCIPRKGVETQIRTGMSLMLAKIPDENSASFTYFDDGYNELQQHGPTYICGEFAATDIKTQNDPTRNFQSSGFRILKMPKRND
jgi:hypothetical protein